MAMARRDSVTVSMARDERGVQRDVARELGLRVDLVGTTSLKGGTSRTSSKVSASGIGELIISSVLASGHGVIHAEGLIDCRVRERFGQSRSRFGPEWKEIRSARLNGSISRIWLSGEVRIGV